jgi:hypothetical protein
MALYTHLGSIPSPLPEGISEAQHLASGWIKVMQPKPVAGEGKEVVWLNWEWVVRNTKPADEPGYQWNWNHSERDWIKAEYGITEQINQEEILIESSSAGITIDLASAGPV